MKFSMSRMDEIDIFSVDFPVTVLPFIAKELGLV